MLYHYYMKINLKLFVVGLLALFLFPCVYAQVTVVKQNGKDIYLDISEHNRRISVGDQFKVILSQEKLTNPKTGKDLGLLNHYSATGKITEVQDLYAIGQLPDNTKVTVGQEAVIEGYTVPAAVPAVAAQSVAASDEPAAPVSDRKIITYNALEREIVSAVKADITAHPEEEIAALDIKGNLLLYTPDGSSLQEIAQHKLPVGYRPLTVSALDKMKTGYAQLFVVAYREKDQRIFTLVFDVQDGQFQQVASLPYFVKEIGCGPDKKLYAQKPFIGGKNPGAARELEYANGQFKLSDDSFPTHNSWLSGINRYKIQNKDTDNFVYTASNGRLRMQLKNKKYTDSPALFATAPNRVKYKQHTVSFYPSLQVYGPEGRATLAGIENTTKFGLLSEQFGQYNGGKLHFVVYDNGALILQETLPLNGFAYDTNCTARGILVPQVLSGEQTVLTEIYR